MQRSPAKTPDEERAEREEQRSHAAITRNVSIRIAACIFLLAWSACANAQWDELRWVDPRLNWRTLETEHFLIHFAEQQRAQARIAAAAAERVYPPITALLNWHPRNRTHVVVLDSADFANGYTTPLPFNLTTIYLSPPDAGELLQNRDWLELLLSHELFHIVHLDKASGSALSPRNVLGRLIPFFPNTLEPSWIVEGLAVSHESDTKRAYGRLGNTTFEGMMRAEAERGFRSLSELNADGRGFPLNRNYLYGSYFFLFLRERYGEDAPMRFVENYSKNLIPFKVASNPVAVTGKPMDALWADYEGWLRARFSPRPAVEGDVLTRAWSISSPVLTPDGARWYIQGDGYVHPKVMRQTPGGEPRSIRQTEDDTRLSAFGSDGVLMSQLEICRNYNLLYDLHAVTASGQRSTVVECGRYRLAAPLEDGRIAAIIAPMGGGEVVLLDHGKPLRSLYRAAAGEIISGIASKGDRIVITALRDERWRLLDISDGRAVELISDASIKHSPRFGNTMNEIFFIADYGKVYDIWSWQRASNSLSRWTRSASGVLEMSAPVNGEVLLTTIEPQGGALRSYRLPAEPLERRPVAAGTESAPATAASIDAEDRPYSPLQSLRPTAWLPLLQIADGAVALGAVVAGNDALQLHEYVLGPMVELTQGELLGTAQYAYDGRHGGSINRTLTVRASESDGSSSKIKAYSIKEDAQWVSLWRSLKLDSRWYWGGGAALAEETFHDLALGATKEQNERVVALVGGYDSRRSRWLSEGPSQGQQLRLWAETSRGLGAAFSGGIIRADWRAHIPLGKTVLSLRWNEARGQSDAEPFEIGGSKSDDLTLMPQINERDFALRGYTTGTPSLVGHNARIGTIEWRGTLADVDRHIMVPPVGVNRVGITLFMDVGAAWESNTSPDYHRGIGAELVFEPKFGYLFGLQTRAGIAKGLDATGATKIYLRAGRTF